MVKLPESTRIGTPDQPFLGLDLAHADTRIPFGAFSQMKNCYVDHKGAIKIRPGLERHTFGNLQDSDYIDWDDCYVLRSSAGGEQACVMVVSSNAAHLSGNKAGFLYAGLADFVSGDAVGGINATLLTRIRNEANSGDHNLVRCEPNDDYVPCDGIHAFIYTDAATDLVSYVHTGRVGSLGAWDTEPLAVQTASTLTSQRYLIQNQRTFQLEFFNTLRYSPPQDFNSGADFWEAMSLTLAAINVLPTYGLAKHICTFRDSILVFCEKAVLRLDTNGPTAEWSFEPIMEDIDIYRGFVWKDLLYIISKSGVFVSDGVSRERIDDLLGCSFAAPTYFEAIEDYIFLNVSIQPPSGAAVHKFLVYSIMSNSWSEFEFDYAGAFVHPTTFFLDPADYWLDPMKPMTLAKYTKSGPLVLVINNDQESDETVSDPFVWFMPLNFMDRSAGGANNDNPSYEDDGTDFVVTLKTGDYDFGLPEKNKECTWVEFEKDGAMGGNVTVNYYINGAASPTSSATVALTSKYVKAPPPGLFRTLAVEVTFEPDDWSNPKDNSFELLSIGFNITNVSEVAS